MSELTVAQCYLELESRDIDPLDFSLETLNIAWVKDFIDLNIQEEIEEDGKTEETPAVEADEGPETNNY